MHGGRHWQRLLHAVQVGDKFNLVLATTINRDGAPESGKYDEVRSSSSSSSSNSSLCQRRKHETAQSWRWPRSSMSAQAAACQPVWQGARMCLLAVLGVIKKTQTVRYWRVKYCSSTSIIFSNSYVNLVQQVQQQQQQSPLRGAVDIVPF
jgi:hypothetical protein